MKQLLVALAFSAVQPCTSLLASENYVYLVAPLEAPRADVSPGIFSGPYLTVDDQKTNQTLVDAVNALSDVENATRDDAALVISALKTANENRDLQAYLEQQMGFGMGQVQAWTKTNIKRRLDQRAFQYVDDKTANVMRKAIGIGTMGLGAGTGLLALPLAFTGVGLIPAIAMLDVSSSIAAAGAKIFANKIPSTVAEKAMPDLMVAMLGVTQAQPEQPIDWTRAPFAPTDELVRRIRHATLLQNAIAVFGTTELQKFSKDDEKLLATAQELFARDVVLGAMLLSVQSRLLDRGQHMILNANLVGALETEQLPALALMAGTLANSLTTLEGIPNAASPSQREARQKEMAHFARWTQAAIVVRSTESTRMDRGDLKSRVDSALGDDANYTTFETERAEKTVDNLRNGLVEARKKKVADRLKGLIKSFRKDDPAE